MYDLWSFCEQTDLLGHIAGFFFFFIAANTHITNTKKN